MRLRTTLLVLLVGLLAWGAIRWLGDPPPVQASRAPLVPPEVFAAWNEIELKLWSGERLKLVREPGAVMLRFGADRAGNPWLYRDPADPAHVEQLLRALQQSWREPLVGTADDVLRMGLDPPRMRVVLRGEGGRELDLGFGNDDPTGGGVLARSVTEQQVFRTGAQVVNVLNDNLDAWRSRTIFGFDELTVAQIDLVRYPLDEGGALDVLIAVKESGPRTWRLTEPRSLMADDAAMAGLVHRVMLLEVEAFISQGFTPEIRKLTGLPDRPRALLTVSTGATGLELELGDYLDNRGYSARLKDRDPELCFAIKKEAVEALLATTADSLRPRRLFPVVERSLVGFTCTGADGAVRFAARRQGDHPRGAWEFAEPFVDRVHEGKGTSSFGQVVADLDRLEVAAFLDGKTPFTPEATLKLRWSQPPILRDRTLELGQVDGRFVARTDDQPGELFAVEGKVAGIVGLDPELFRNRILFEPNLDQKILAWRIETRDGNALVAERPTVSVEARAAAGTPEASTPKIQAAVAGLFNKECSAYVRARDVASDPFEKPLVTVTLKLQDGEVTLVVGAEGPAGHYCRLRPRLPDDVYAVVPRLLLDRLLNL